MSTPDRGEEIQVHGVDPPARLLRHHGGQPASRERSGVFSAVVSLTDSAASLMCGSSTARRPPQGRRVGAITMPRWHHRSFGRRQPVTTSSS
jgi:hypothetical protein